MPFLDAGSLSGLPPFALGRVFTDWGIDPVLTVLTVWIVGLYLFGVWTLHSRGDSWPIGRTLAFVVAGMGGFAFATASGLAAYDTQKLRALARAGGGAAALPVNGALALYLDFVNLFLAVLRLFGSRRD